MRKLLFMIVLFTIAVAGHSQQFKTFSGNHEDLCPEGWECNNAAGDLNGDNVNDLVFWALPDNPENITTRDDGYVMNFNRPVLAIYFSTDDPAFHLWKEYDNVLPAREDYATVDISMHITSRRTLVIETETFFSAGSWSQPKNKYVFRYQNGDFYCIGEESDSFARNTGDGEKISINYLTHKKSITTYNVFDKSNKERTTWKNIPKAPLKRLGDFEL